MKCNYCSNSIESKWNYCPSCGHTIDSQNMFVNLINKHLEVIKKKLSTPTNNESQKRVSNGIQISITTGFGSPPRVSVAQLGSNKRENYEPREKTVKRTLPNDVEEPETVIKKTNEVIVVDAKLPGVKSENDVEINTMPNSVELRAYAGEKGYFKILNIPNSFDLVEKDLKDEKLKLKFSL